MVPNVSHRVHAQQKIVALGVLLTLRNITVICGPCHKNKCNSAVHQTFWSNIIHQNRWSQRLLVCFQGEKKQKKKPSSTPPQMAINFNFLPKTTFYTASLRHSVLASSPLRLKKGEKMHEGADKSDTLHINCTYRRTAPAPPPPAPFFVITTTPGSYRVNKPRRGFWRDAATCDNAVARCPLLADRAYNEVKDQKRRGGASD